MSPAYFVPLVPLPIVISEPGDYITRCGELVTVEQASRKNDFGNVGYYGATEEQITERWHRSGRVSATRESVNDVVSRA
jgi:hypothetical protein